jgi:ubiquinone biosynthesis accessory factor UbiK
MSTFPPQGLADHAARLAAKISDLSASANSALPASEIKKNIGALLSAQLSKLHLVSRAEFDIQTALLAKAQARLSQLEAQIAQLEQAAQSSNK